MQGEVQLWFSPKSPEAQSMLCAKRKIVSRSNQLHTGNRVR
jgi:hypothetical protein